MFHELLLALLGHSGKIVQDSGTTFELSQDITFIHEGEKTILNELVQLGHYYQTISTFVEKKLVLEFKGLYPRAVASGLSKILDGYRRQILRVEEEALKHGEGIIPLSSLQATLDEVSGRTTLTQVCCCISLFRCASR